MPGPIITLTTDFGLRDPYVAEMKAVILSINPNATIVDISHETEKFNIRTGAYVLACAAPYFPKGTIHVAVIDPDVGTKRRAIIIQTRTMYFIGPDNGVLSLAVKGQNIEHICEITNRKLMLPNISNTFHGRDIFAPAAAHLSNGTSPVKYGSELGKIVKPGFAEIRKQKDMMIGEVLQVDDFGNIVTNFTQEELKSLHITKKVGVEIAHTKLELKLCKAYTESERNIPFVITGSHSFLEISINKGDAAKKLNVRNENKVKLYRV